MKISNHSKQRGKERAGLNKTALERTASIAWEKGLRADSCAGKLHRYLEYSAINHKTTPVVYGNHIFTFGGDGGLVTVLDLPKEFRGVVRKLMDKIGKSE